MHQALTRPALPRVRMVAEVVARVAPLRGVRARILEHASRWGRRADSEVLWFLWLVAGGDDSTEPF